jgi:nicotinamidase-related amidase
MSDLDPTRAALVALDLQNYGIHPKGYWATHGEPDWPAIARPAVKSTAKVLSVEGTWGSEFYEPVRPAPAELVLYKRGVSALAGTELDRLLRLRDVNTLVLAGVATHFAAEGTAREAVDRGYRVVVLEDCCASRVSAVHRHSIDVILRSLGRVTTAQRFIRELENQGPSA